jgi:hypothetical protein
LLLRRRLRCGLHGLWRRFSGLLANGFLLRLNLLLAAGTGWSAWLTAARVNGARFVIRSA